MKYEAPRAYARGIFLLRRFAAEVIKIMILSIHILAGAAIGLKLHNWWFVFLLSIFAHYLMDTIPHREYDISSLKKKLSKKSMPDIAQITLDSLIGITLAFWFTWNSAPLATIVAGIIGSVLPDFLTFIYWQTKTPLLKRITDFHRYTIHPKNNKNTPLIWGLGTQIIAAAVIIAIIIVK